MGQHAEDILNGDVDQFTGEWLGDGKGFSRSAPSKSGRRHNTKNITYWEDKDGTIRDLDHNPKKFKKGTKAIRRELAILIQKMKLEQPDVEESHVVNQARQIINVKYGKGWRCQT